MPLIHRAAGVEDSRRHLVQRSQLPLRGKPIPRRRDHLVLLRSVDSIVTDQWDLYRRQELRAVARHTHIDGEAVALLYAVIQSENSRRKLELLITFLILQDRFAGARLELRMAEVALIERHSAGI